MSIHEGCAACRAPVLDVLARRAALEVFADCATVFASADLHLDREGWSRETVEHAVI